MSDKVFIAIAGNIGVGKSSLTQILSQRLECAPFYEAVEDNPYLADFYGDMARWSFHSQIFFLSRRLQHHRHLLNHPGHVIQDRSIYEDAEIFARNLFQQSKMTERDYQCYRNLYEGICDFLPPPDVMIYLQAPVGVLVERITRRGRDYEQQISIAYLAELNDLYDEWASHWTRSPLITIPTAELDFVHQPNDLAYILASLPNPIRALLGQGNE